MGVETGSDAAPLRDRLLTTRQVLNVLHISRTTLYHLIDRGELHPLHIGRTLRFPMADLRLYVLRLRARHDESGEPSGHMGLDEP
jgi:excisionase family DNA binding protein